MQAVHSTVNYQFLTPRTTGIGNPKLQHDVVPQAERACTSYMAETSIRQFGVKRLFLYPHC